MKLQSFMGCLGYILVFMMLALPASAAPVDPYPLTASQPNGIELTLIPHGDEFQHWNTLKETGHTVIKNEANGYWEYAENNQDGTLRGSGIRVLRGGANAPARIGPGARPPRNTQHETIMNEMIMDAHKLRLTSSGALQSSAGETGGLSPGDPQSGPVAAPGDWTPATVSGAKKLLVVLVNFSDRSFQTTASSWYTSVFDEAVKSVAKFYKDNSFGLMTIAPVVHSQPGSPNGVISVSLGSIHPNYHNSFSFATDQAIGNAALQQITSSNYVDFDSYDTNLDGTLDPTEVAIYFVYAGFESAANTGLAPRVWAHAWWMSGTGLTAGTKTVERWALNGELYNTTTQQPMGVIAHELGHQICGLPDLYDISGNNAGLGLFSLMAGGSWGGEWEAVGGTTPTSLDAWSREYLGWASPVTNPSGDVTIPAALSGSSSTIKFTNNSISSTEYFLVENREPVSWDRGLLRFFDAWGGILITHVDITAGVQGSNDINSYTANNVAGGGHQGVVPVQAATSICDMLATGTICNGSSTNLFHAQNNTNWTSLTNPNSSYYNASASNFGLFSISSSGSIMTAHASTVMPAPPYAPAIGTATAGNAQASVTFIPPTSDNGGQITGYTATATPGPISVSGAASPITLTGLTNGTAYTFTVRAINSAGSGPASKPSNSVTPTNGICGPAHSTAFSVMPITGLCTLGTPSAVAGAGPWSWTCDTVSCSATFVPDSLAPTTSATPRSGDYDTARSVTLSCNDGTGSGCATTYYCLGSGCTPTTVYSGSFSVSSSQIVRFYSKDVAANTETVKSQTYIIGAVAQATRYLSQGVWPQLPQQWYFSGPGGVATDSSGNVYVADTYNDRIQKFDPNGVFIASWGTYGASNGQFSSPEGVAVDSAGNIYVIDSGNNRIQKFDSNGTSLAVWGGTYGSGLGQFKSPEGIAVDQAGNIYIADTYNNRIQKFNSGGGFITAWGTYGSGNGQLDSPYGIAVDSNGNIYVADCNNNRIQKFNSSGGFLAAWGTYGAGNGQFSYPEGVAVDSAGNIYVIDTYNYRIQKLDSNGGFLASWQGASGNGDGQYNSPGGIAVSPGGTIYVADTWNNRIQKFDSNGAFAASWDSNGSGYDQLDYPSGLAVDPSGAMYVADTSNNRIQKFDSSGTHVSSWGTSGNANGLFNNPSGVAADLSGTIYVADTSNNRLQKFDSSGAFLSGFGSYGSGNGQFSYPAALTVASNGYLYVADTSNHRIQKFDSSGVFVAAWGSKGSGNGQFNYPAGITVDASGFLYVADTSNHRVQKFDSSGAFVAAWGSMGSGNGQFSSPKSIAVDQAGYLYVSDTSNNRIQKFDSSGVFVAVWGSYGGGGGEMFWPQGIAVDTTGIVTVADSRNNRIQYFSPAYSLTATATGSGSGGVTSNSGVITFAYPGFNTAIATLAKGTEITLTATANGGSFVSWSGCYATGGSASAATCSINALATDKVVTAIFTKELAPPSNTEVQIPTVKGELTLTWTKPVEADFSHIHIYRSTVAGTLGTLIADSLIGIKYTCTGLSSQTKYYYTVRSVDSAGNESTNTTQVYGTTLDKTPPAVPTNISATFTGPTPAITIAWTKPTDTDFSHIHIYRSTSLGTLGPLVYDNITTTSKIDSNLENGITYYYTVQAVDARSNETSNIAQVSATVTLADISGPGAVSNVNIAFPANGDKSTLTWTNPGGDFAIIRIYRSTASGQKGIFVYQGTAATFTDSNINPGSTYWYTIDAIDTAGNVSAYTAPSVTPLDTQIPGCIAQLKAAPLSGAKIQLTWLRSPSTDVNLYYDIYGDNGTGTISETSTTSTTHPVTTWTSGALTNGTTYQYVIKVADGTGNVSATCATVAATALTNPSAAGVSASIKIPYSGKKYGGNQLQLMAEQVSGSVGDLQKIQFEYFNGTSWVKITPAPGSTVNPDFTSPYFIHWDVSALPVGNYKIQAVAYNINGIPDSTPGYITVSIDNASPDVLQSSTSSQETVNTTSGGTVATSDASIIIPAGTFTANATVTMTTSDPATKAATVPTNYDNALSFHDITTNGTITADSTIAVEIPYADANDDLKLDTAPLISVLDLKICRNISGQTWTCLDSTVDTANKVVRANTTTLGLMALLVPPVTMTQPGYNMASVALTPSNSATNAVFGGYVLDYNPTTQAFFKPATIQPGHGYFIWGARTLKPTGTEITTATHAVAIKKGWNVIGNPYKMKLPVQSLTLNCGAPKSITQAELDGEIVGTFFYAINGAYELATTQTVTDTIDPWKGYWLLSDKDCNLIFTKP